jgi:hypothetical protein
MRDNAIGSVTLPAQFWADPHVVEALEDRDFGDLFQRVLDTTGISQIRLGTAVLFSQGRISAIIHRKSKVKETAVMMRIADGLNMPRHARAALGFASGAEIQLASEPARPASPSLRLIFSNGYPDTAGQAVEAVTALWRADQIHAQDLLSAPLDPGAWTAAALAWLTGSSDASLPVNVSGRAVGLADVARVRGSSALLAEMDNRFGGAHAHSSLIRYLDGEASDLLAGSYTEATGRELFSAISEATLLVGFLSAEPVFA